MPADESLGDLIARKRRKDGVTQEDLAQAVGCSTAMISKIESGARVPARELGERIREYLEIDPEIFEQLAERGAPKKRATALVEAIRLGRENGQRAKEMRRRLQVLRSEADGAAREFAQDIEKEALNILAVFSSAAAVVSEIPPDFLAPPAKHSSAARDNTVEGAFNDAQFRLKGHLHDLFTIGASGLGAGGVTAASAGMGLYTAVASFASASTGTAIASLSGAAATKATLAWLGGGALAAGGAGIAGGTAVLVGAVTMPLLVVTGTVVVSQGSRILEKQQANRERLDEAEEVLTSNERVVKDLTKRVTKVGFAVEAAQAKARRAQSELEKHPLLAGAIGGGLPSEASVGEPVRFAELTTEQRDALETLGKLVAALSALLALPIGLRLKTEERPRLVTDDSVEGDDAEGEHAQETPVLDSGTEEENEYIDYAINQLFAEIAMI